MKEDAATPRPQVLVGFLLCLTYSNHGAAEPAVRPPLPESILTESASDIDATEAGELEYELNFGLLRAHTGGARALVSSLEVEWRALADLGMRFEPSFVQDRDAQTRNSAGISGALAWGLFHDFANDFHVQTEVLARSSSADSPHAHEPTETQLPVALDFLGAKRFGLLTLRMTVGAEAGGSFAHAPLHTDAAVLIGALRNERFGFLSLDVRADWARVAPWVLAPEIISDARPIGVPVRLGIALPVNLGSASTNISYGFFLRLIWLTEREARFGRHR